MIVMEEEQKQFTLHTAHTTYQMRASMLGHLLHCYYGPRVDDRDLSGYFNDTLTMGGFSPVPGELAPEAAYFTGFLPMEFATTGVGDYRSPSLEVVNSDGSRAFDPRLKAWRVLPGKYQLEGLPAFFDPDGETLEITLEDPVTRLAVVLLYGVLYEQDCITRAVRVENHADKTIRLEKVMSATLPLRHNRYDCLHFYGHHTMERQMARDPLIMGTLSFGATQGSSSHKHNPGFILAEHGATETAGEAFGMAFVYSGNFLVECESDEMKGVRVNCGIHPDGFCFHLAPEEHFQAPEALLTYSAEGLSALSHHFHDAIRENLCRSRFQKTKRPVLLNNWEGTYFNFTGDKIVEMARAGAEMGADLMVLDDGWFGARNSDRAGLGDWVPNEEKLGGTLSHLIRRIKAEGLSFGLWFEPEMVNEDSALYRTYPEWVLNIPGRPSSRGRKQLVLDLSRKEVQDHLIRTLNKILDNNPISYVKWDYNRYMSEVYNVSLPPERQGEVFHRYILGLYRVMDQVILTHPDILFEGCSGGGGRFDCGMLYYQPQIWCSDNTDCLARLKIQGGTSYIYPPSTMGAHVAASPRKAVGRTAPLHTRAVAAMSGTFGYELDTTTLSTEEKAECRVETERYLRYQQLVNQGDYERLNDPFSPDCYTAWQHTAKDQSLALISVVIKEYQPKGVLYICPRGLNAQALYRVNGGGLQSGLFLMQRGFCLKPSQPDLSAFQFVVEQEK